MGNGSESSRVSVGDIWGSKRLLLLFNSDEFFVGINDYVSLFSFNNMMLVGGDCIVDLIGLRNI